MKHANERARNVILRLVHEGPWEMSDEDRTVFARWAIMLSMTYEFADVHTVVTPQIDRENLSRNLLPPENWGVFIAPYEGVRWREQINHRALGSRDEHGNLSARPDGQNNVFGLGKTAVNTISGRVMDLFPPHLWQTQYELYCVWPLITTSKPQTLDDVGMDNLATLGTGVIFD